MERIGVAVERRPYRSLRAKDLERIEARRVAAGIALQELCGKSGVSTATYYRMRRSGLAFKRHVNALAMALRTLESERRGDDKLFPFEPGSRP